MLRNFGKETHAIWRAVSDAMLGTYPSKQFRAEMILAGVSLGLTEQEIRRTENLNERRALINEFDKIKVAIEGGIRLLDKGQRRQDIPPERKAVCVS